MLDTRTATSLISVDFLANVGHSILPTKLTAKGAGKQAIELLGVVSLQISMCNVIFEFKFQRGAFFGYILFGFVRSK